MQVAEAWSSVGLCANVGVKGRRISAFIFFDAENISRVKVSMLEAPTKRRKFPDLRYANPTSGMKRSCNYHYESAQRSSAGLASYAQTEQTALWQISCHDIDDKTSCSQLSVHTRGFVLIDRQGFAFAPCQN